MEMEDVHTHLSVLLLQEETNYRCTDYMKHERRASSDDTALIEPSLRFVEECANVVCDSKISKSKSTGSLRDVKDISLEQQQPCHLTTYPRDQSFCWWRRQMFDWGVMVVDSFGMDRECVAVSFNLLDRYIALELKKPQAPPITRDDYQLFHMVCLYLTVKILEPFPRKLTAETLVDMSKNYYNKEVILSTEMDILKQLDWHLHAPTGLGAARLLCQLYPGNVSFDMASTMVTLTEIAVSDSFFVTYKPSVIGLASLLHAARLDGQPEATTQEFLGNLKGAIRVQDSADFRTVYLQMEKLFFH